MVMVFFILLNYGDFLLTKIGCFRLTLFGDFHLTLTRLTNAFSTFTMFIAKEAHLKTTIYTYTKIRFEY